MPDTQRLVAGRYRLAGQIGTGGMGMVWLARDEVLRRDVAVKEVVLPAGLTGAERAELMEGTLREARAAGRLSHPNVIQVYDVVMFEERPWIVMEYVPSRSLYQTIRADGPLPPRRVAEIGLSVLAGLQAAHRAKVWHRDVKPGNVLLAKDGRVVLTDFGLATYDGDGGVTRSGLILGSAQYISPERARDGVSGPEADMWSLGATLYAAVEGRSPYARESSMATLTALATVPPDTPRRAGPLRPVLLGLLRKNPRHRLTATETEKLLRAVVSGEMKGRAKLPRQRSDSPPPAELPVAGEAVAAPGAVAPAMALAAAPAEAGTSTQDTYQYEAHPRRRWPWLVMGVVLTAAVAGGAVLLTQRPAGGPGVVTATTPALSAAAGVQACAAAPEDSGVPVTGVSQLPNEHFEAYPEWVYYQDRSGFHISVPQVWRVWRMGTMVCFRQNKGDHVAAVIAQGARSGATADLMETDIPVWRAAAALNDYTQVARRQHTYADSPSTELEYTYDSPAGPMHGDNLLVRTHTGQVFLLCWLGPEYAWTSDSHLRDVFQPTFGLD